MSSHYPKKTASERKFELRITTEGGNKRNIHEQNSHSSMFNR